MPDVLVNINLKKLHNFSPHNFYKRHLPHWQPEKGEYFVTFGLKGSLPKDAVTCIKEEYKQISGELAKNQTLADSERINRKMIFKWYEDLFDKGSWGPTWLKNPEIAEIVKKSTFFFNQSEYDLYAFTIMSNHDHMVFKLMPNSNNSVTYPVSWILGRLKSYTANKCNQKLKRTGAFWQDESYDHVIRDSKELTRVMRYVLNNPVKAELVENWTDWRFTYCKPAFLNDFR